MIIKNYKKIKKKKYYSKFNVYKICSHLLTYHNARYTYTILLWQNAKKVMPNSMLKKKRDNNEPCLPHEANHAFLPKQKDNHKVLYKKYTALSFTNLDLASFCPR